MHGKRAPVRTAINPESARLYDENPIGAQMLSPGRVEPSHAQRRRTGQRSHRRNKQPRWSGVVSRRSGWSSCDCRTVASVLNVQKTARRAAFWTAIASSTIHQLVRAGQVVL
jgi:hypothetical protein